MNTYLVGGAVRDMVMGREVHDLDYVVVGSTHDEMISLGFRQVGADFPVYLHPVTNEEYALARTERRTGVGYKGFETVFTPDVTLEMDLSRRDLTINAMALDLETQDIVDPFNGLEDLEAKVLRATTEAFEEDPLRILRLFRFASQFGPDWLIDLETYQMVSKNSHRLEEIVPERKWKEFQKALESKNPDIFMDEMAQIGQLPELAEMSRFAAGPVEHHPEGDAYSHTMLCVQQAVIHNATPEQVFAMMCHDLGKVPCWKERGNLHGHESAGVPVVEALCDRFKVPNSFRKMALAVTEFHGKVHSVQEARPATLFDLYVKMGGAKDLYFFKKVVECSKFDAWGRGPTKEGRDYPQEKYFLNVVNSLVDNRQEISKLATEISQKWKGNPDMVREQIRAMKIGFIKAKMRELRNEEQS